MTESLTSRSALWGALIALALTIGASTASATCVGITTFVKAHTWDDVDMDMMTSVGDVLHYTIVFCEPGAGNRRCRFTDALPPELTLQASTLLCTPEPGTRPPDACVEQPPGSDTILVEYSSQMDRNSCLTVTFDAVVTAAPPTDICNQAVSTVNPNDRSDNDCHPLIPAPDLELSKVAAKTSVAPGGTVDFDITLHNIGTADLVAGGLRDVLEPCFEPLGAAGAACDPLVVRCAGPACAGTACVYSAGGLGFDLTGITLRPDDRFAGGPDELVVTVTATAGTNEVMCTNTATTADPDSPSIVAADTVSITRLPDLEITKTALSAAVAPGSPVSFEIRVHNLGAGALASGLLDDLLDACFLPFGTVGSPCDPAVVACASPGCAATVCSYTNGGLGFSLAGFALSPDDGAPGGPDEIVVTVTATAGPTEGACSNTATTSDPDSPTLADSDTVDIRVARPDLEIAKTALSPVVLPGAPVDFDIVVHNYGAAAMAGAQVVDTLEPCFAPLGLDGAPCDPLIVSCSGAACAAAICTYSNGGLGFTYAGLDLAADDGLPGGSDEVTITVTATAGPVETRCANDVATSDPDSPSLVANDAVDIATRADLTIDKRALGATVPPLGMVDFDITVHNVGTAPLLSAQVVDTMDPCFEALGVVGSACDPLLVRCNGPGCAGAICTYTNGGLGFTYSGLNLAADDGVPGGPDEVVITVTATAGINPGPCSNQVETSDPDSPSLTSADSVDITTAPGCDLMQGDATFPPVTPTIGSLYSANCGPGDMRLAVPNTPSVAPGDLADAYADVAGTLRLYQMECGCAQGIKLVKNTATARIALQFF